MSEIRSQAPPARDELERSAIGWQQYISRALGCKPGQLTYQLEECIEKIEALKPRTVNAPSEFEALPVGSVVLLTSRRAGHVAWQKQDGDRWCEASDWECSMTSLELWAVNLPATVLFTPGDAG